MAKEGNFFYREKSFANREKFEKTLDQLKN